MLWLRHITIATEDLAATERELSEMFALRPAYRDPNVERTLSIVNCMLPVGDDFLEPIAPLRPDGAAARFIARRGVGGGYLVVISTDDLPAARARVDALGARIVHAPNYPNYAGFHLHPKDTGGSMLEINWQADWNAPNRPYHPAGPDWTEAVDTSVVDAIAAVELQAPDPAAVAALWAKILDQPVRDESGGPAIRLDRGLVRFVADRNGLGPGIRGVDLHLSREPGSDRPRSARWRPAETTSVSGLEIRFV